MVLLLGGVGGDKGVNESKLDFVLDWSLVAEFLSLSLSLKLVLVLGLLVVEGDGEGEPLDVEFL
jgi:hypothetical protein